MATRDDSVLTSALEEVVRPLTGASSDFDALLELVGDARIVLIGEASHGTHEFYRQRALITRRLIEEKGFSAVAIEGDFPDAYRVNRYVRDQSADPDAEQSLSGFARFPTWMWRNSDVLDFIGWLRSYNETRRRAEQAGFYGLDLYSLHASSEAVVAYLDEVAPEAAERARSRYACFRGLTQEPQKYGQAVSLGLTPECEEAVVKQLQELRESRDELLRGDGVFAEDELFFATTNAQVVANAERYYRAMMAGRTSSWNLRDTHMVDTLDTLIGHLVRQGTSGKVVVWAHNSHVGDSRATHMSLRGEVNVGQLVRERHGADCRIIGFGTHSGTVTAASNWGRPAERKRVRPALPGSYEALFHEVRHKQFLLDVRDLGEAGAALSEERLQRFIGVIYLPESERYSHYFETRLPDQYDALLWFDQTRALEPLERTPRWEAGEPPETYPTGL